MLEVQVLSHEFTLYIFATTVFGIILGFAYRGERSQTIKIAEIAAFLSVASSLFGPAGRTAVLTLPFVASFYYGWLIRGSLDNIESSRNRRLLFIVAALFGLVGAFATAFFFEI